MKSRTTHFLVAAVTALALGISPTADAADKGCSNASLRGTFAYTSTGFITAASAGPVGPLAEVGTQTFDGNGKTTATATLTANGTIFQLTITGTYTVNPDCTGTFSLQATFPPASGIGTVPVDVFFVLDNTNTEFQAMETDPGLVITRIGRLQFPAVGDWRQ